MTFCITLALMAMVSCLLAPGANAVTVKSEPQLRDAWANPWTRSIQVKRDIALRSCSLGDPIRESARPIRVLGGGHTIRQTCFETRLFRQDGTGFVQLEDLTLQRGGSDGPGAAVTTRGEIKIVDSRISENLAEEPGGGVFSMRKATIIRSVMTGNLANDDGGAVYARRGGVTVRDSVLNGNLVDGSGGAIGSTGDIKIVRSQVDGNITDGDGGAVYTDEDGDVTVVDSSISGNTADGPGGGIFTLDGDVTIVRSVLNGNRADDRGGAVSGEADVVVIDSTISRNVAEAHAAGGIWARGNLYVSASTVSQNSAQGLGGGILGGGDVKIAYSSISDNVAPETANVGASATLELFGSVIGPPKFDEFSDPVNCRAAKMTSRGFNVSSDASCQLGATGDVQNHVLPTLGDLLRNGGLGDSRLPLAGSAIVDRVPDQSCAFVPFGYRREGEQHLADLGINPIAPTQSDQLGGKRPFGPGCDTGSVELGATAAGAPVREKTRGPAWRATEPADEGRLDAAKARRAVLQRADVPVNPARGTMVEEPASTDVGVPTRAGAGSISARAKGSDLARISRGLRRVSRHLKPLERTVIRYRKWRKCVTEVPVSRFGALDRRFGFVYDEVDGSGQGFQSALALDRHKPADFRILRFADRHGCSSARTVVGGTADAARAPAGRRSTFASNGLAARGASASGVPELSNLQQKFSDLEQRARTVERSAGRFDEWESCLTWLPVTEYGDPGGRFGYRKAKKRKSRAFGAAVTIDVSAWDDPDYSLLTFSGRDRPGRPSCDDEGDDGAPARSPVSAPGKSASDTRSLRDTGEKDTAGDVDPEQEQVEDLARDTGSLEESVSDLVEPVFEFESFDQCMYTVGMTQYGGKKGYRFRHGKSKVKGALAMDMAGFDKPQFNFLAFSGEEPPQIECNEDASGQGTDE